MFEDFSGHYLAILTQVDSNIKFLNQKLKCLELVFSEFAKIKKAIRDAKSKEVQKEKQIVLDM